MSFSIESRILNAKPESGEDHAELCRLYGIKERHGDTIRVSDWMLPYYWSAVFEDTDNGERFVGTGNTQAEAIADLLEMVE